MELEEFRTQLTRLGNDNQALVEFCRATVLNGTPKLFEGRETDYYNFQKRIADHFSIRYNDIYISGSAKLGFSAHKNRKFDSESDIDVTIISEVLYDEMMQYIKQFQYSLRLSRTSVSESELKIYHSFLEHIAIGWFRPDKLPTSFLMSGRKDKWFKFFTSISYGRSEAGDYKVSGGIFRTYQDFEDYTINSYRNIATLLTLP